MRALEVGALALTMKFGKLLRATVDARMATWRDYVLDYKRLKQRIAELQMQGAAGRISIEEGSSSFTEALDVEVAKVNDFYSDRIEEAVIIQHALRQQVDALLAQPHALEARTGTQRSIVACHFNLLMLQNYVALNFTGVVKILKKFDKKFAGAGLRAEYINAIVALPFYQCQSLGQLVETAEELFAALEACGGGGGGGGAGGEQTQQGGGQTQQQEAVVSY